MMMYENQQVECSGLPQWLDDLKRKKETVKGDRGVSAKNALMVKSIFSLEYKDSEWINSKNVLLLDNWMRFGVFYKEFRVGLFIRCH